MCGQYSDEQPAGVAHTFDGLPRVIGQTLIKCHTQGEEEGDNVQKKETRPSKMDVAPWNI